MWVSRYDHNFDDVEVCAQGDAFEVSFKHLKQSDADTLVTILSRSRVELSITALEETEARCPA